VVTGELCHPALPLLQLQVVLVPVRHVVLPAVEEWVAAVLQ